MTDLPTNLEREHWDLDSNIDWIFVLPRDTGESVREAVERHTMTALDVVTPFGQIGRIEWTTEAGGEGAAEWRVTGGELGSAIVEPEKAVRDLPVDLEHEYWTFKTDIAWLFTLPREAGESVRAALERYTLLALDLIGGFGRLRRIEWVTQSAGEDAAELRVPGEDPSRSVREIFQRLPDAVQATIDLDLTCTSSGGVEFLIPQGATLYVRGDPEDHGEVLFDVSVSTDIYSPRSFGRIRANSVLAALNGPRLSAFLTAVRDIMRAKLRMISAPSYKGLVTDRGFAACPETDSK